MKLVMVVIPDDCPDEVIIAALKAVEEKDLVPCIVRASKKPKIQMIPFSQN